MRTASGLISALLGLAVVVAGCEDPPLSPDDERLALGRGNTAPAAPSGLTASAISSSHVSVGWKDNSSNEAGFEIFGSITGLADFSLWATPGPSVTEQSFTGIAASQEYCFKARAFTTKGKNRNYSAFSNTACATTPATPPPPPVAPSAVRASPINSSSVALTWTDNSNNEDGFRVERLVGSCIGTWENVGTTGPNVTSFTDGERAAEQPLCYRVRAFNGGGVSNPSIETVTVPPAGPTSLAATTVSHQAIDITWVDNSAYEDGYEVQRASAREGPYAVVTFVGPNTASYRDGQLSSSSTYWYRVRAGKNWGFSDYSNDGSATTNPTPPPAPPASPTNTDAKPAGSTTALITWTDNSWNEDGFRVERSLDGGATWTPASSTSPDGAVFYDLEQPSEQPLCYRVVAFNGLGDSESSSVDCTALPARPSNLITIIVDGWTTDLSWNDNSGHEDGYEVWGWYGGLLDEMELAAQLPANSTSYRDIRIFPYAYYWVVATTMDGGYSDFSDAASPTTASSTPSLSSTTIRPRLRLGRGLKPTVAATP